MSSPDSMTSSRDADQRAVCRMLSLGEWAAAEGSAQSVRAALTAMIAETCPVSPALVIAVQDGSAVVLAASDATVGERLPLDRGILESVDADSVSIAAVPGGRVALTRIDAEDDRTLLVGGVLTVEEPSPSELFRLRAAARAGGLALRIAHERQAGARARSTAERLIDAGISLASYMSLREVLSRLVEMAREILGARYAALGVLDRDGTGLESFVTSGLDDHEVAAIGALPTGRGLLGLLIRDPRPVRLRDISTDPRSCGFPPNHPPMGSFLGVPVALRGRVFGNLYVTEKESSDAFTEEDERVALTLAAQAAVAIDNARRYEEEVRRLNEMESVQEVARAILSTLDLDELLPLIVRRARRLTGADTIGVALGGSDGMDFRFAHGVDALALETVNVPSDPDRLPAHLSAVLGVPEVEIEPLEVGGDRVGILAALTQSPMDETARRLLSLFASQAAVAVANAEIFAAERSRLRESAQIQAAEARAAAAAEGLRTAIEAQEAERARVARELHDEAGQSLTALALNLRYLEDHLDDEGRARLGDLRQMVNGVSSSLRSLATDLRPSGLREHGLASAIERQAAKLREATGMGVDVSAEGLPEDLPGEMQIALFRVIQEALTNVARHSGAGQVSVVVSRLGGRIRVVVEDDGRGFDPAAPTSRLGLRGIRERVELLGGELRIESAVGAGTAVVVDVDAEGPPPRYDEPHAHVPEDTRSPE